MVVSDLHDAPPTPAGWYPDPDDAAQLRYWDGARWTDHRAPAVLPEAASSPPEAMKPAGPRGRQAPAKGAKLAIALVALAGLGGGIAWWAASSGDGDSDRANVVTEVQPDDGGTFEEGYEDGWDAGWDAGYDAGFVADANADLDLPAGSEGYDEGYQEGYVDGYEEGYDDGYEAAFGGGTDPTEPTDATEPTTPTTGQREAGGFDIGSLIGRDSWDDDVRRMMDGWGCDTAEGAVGTNLCPNAGVIIDTSIMSDLIMMIDVIGSGSASGFETYQGDLPLGLSWGMARGDVEGLLQSRYGAPLNVFEGVDETSYASQDYAVGDQTYSTINVWFSNDTGELIRIHLDIDPPDQEW